MSLKVGVYGSSGKMGQAVFKVAAEDKRFSLAEASHLTDSPKFDVIVDFSSADGTATIAAWCKKNKVPLVSGTTGLNPLQDKELKEYGAVIPILWSPNMSLGLNLMAESLKLFAKRFSGDDVAVEEIHHRHKKDSPSGTAKFLQRIIKDNLSRGVQIVEPVSIRGGEIFGTHRVYFFFKGEQVLFEHTALGREVFARGSLEAALWVVKQKPGFYSMEDFLGSR